MLKSLFNFLFRRNRTIPNTFVRSSAPMPMLTGEELQKAIDGFERQAQENYEVSRDIQLRDGVDRRGRKIKGKRS